jgi:hypothetical protein
MRRSGDRILTTHVGSFPTLEADDLEQTVVVWGDAERKLGQAWRNHTVSTSHTYGTPPVEEAS